MWIYRIAQVQFQDTARLVLTVECRKEGEDYISILGLTNDEGRISITSNSPVDMVGLYNTILPSSVENVWRAAQRAEWSDDELCIKKVSELAQHTRVWIARTLQESLQHTKHSEIISDSDLRKVVDETGMRKQLKPNNLINAFEEDKNDDSGNS